MTHPVGGGAQQPNYLCLCTFAPLRWFDCVFQVHRCHKLGHLEMVYENALAHRLRKLGLDVKQQYPLKGYDEDGSLIERRNSFPLCVSCAFLRLGPLRLLRPVRGRRPAGRSGARWEEPGAGGSTVWGAKLGSDGSPRRGRRAEGSIPGLEPLWQGVSDGGHPAAGRGPAALPSTSGFCEPDGALRVSRVASDGRANSRPPLIHRDSTF
jgi:hypothetical protein